MIRIFSVIAIFTLLLNVSASAQNSTAVPAATPDNYTQVIVKRADKIVSALSITDSVVYKRVLNIIVDQYRTLGTIHDARNARAKELKATIINDKPTLDAKIKVIDDERDSLLSKQHKVYLTKLTQNINASQIEGVKNLMTYNILPITFKAYQEEVLTLTDEQKAKIKGWLTEAREMAIDAESSDKKHAVFGKYKGRINNYLSAQGYDMKKEGEEWQKRIKEKKSEN